MFNEKTSEYSLKTRQQIPVVQSAKYLASRAKAIKAIQERPYLNEADFWILMNETKTGKMMYTGLIISHNACLKINDNMPEKDKFNPDCVSVDKSGYGNSLVFTKVLALPRRTPHSAPQPPHSARRACLTFPILPASLTTMPSLRMRGICRSRRCAS